MTDHTKNTKHTGNSGYEDPLWDRAESYVLEKMNAAERGAFESEMAGNPALKHAVEDIRKSVAAIRVGGMVREMDAIHSRRGRFVKRSFRINPGIAAAVVVAMGLLIWLIARPNHNEKLFAQYVTTDPGLPVPMSATTDYDFYDAMVDYKMEDYSVALEKWQAMYDAHSYNDTLSYYLASAYFNIGKYEESLPLYEEVTGQSVFYDRSQWYRALIFVRTERIEELQSIQPDPNSLYTERIEELKSQMK